VEDLGTYNPRAKENQVLNFKKESVLEWLKKGAIPSPSVLKLIEKEGVKS